MYILFVLHVLVLFATIQAEVRVVRTSQGVVRGYRAAGGNYFTFFGIPYASEPKGKDKYKAPLPGPVWREPFEAVDPWTICPQIIPAGTPFKDKTNNCLVANVYVPDTKERYLPVVVYVHGGGYIGGAGIQMAPTGLLTRGNFIAVNFNYRLGVHGFLCLGTKRAPGNAGMKDMVALLRWVRRNIASFGGNPFDVTIDGASAGSSAVDLLMLSPLARGLFHKVIPESGQGVAVWSLQMDPFKNAQFFASILNFESKNVYELEDFFTELSTENVTSITRNLTIFKDTTIRAVPCVERRTNGLESFLTESASRILGRGDYRKVPYLVGFTKRDAMLILSLFNERKNELNNNFTVFLPADLVFPNNKEKEKVAKSIKEFYFGNEEVTDEKVYEYLALFGDVTFAHPTLRTVRALAEAGSDSIYLYEYEYSDASDRHPLPNSTLSVKGPGHCAQTAELLEQVPDNLLSKEHLSVRNTLRRFWINFIRTGKPLPKPTKQFPRGWPSASVDRSPHMSINSTSSLRGVLRPKEAAFWDRIYDKYYLEPIPPPRHTRKPKDDTEEDEEQ